MPHHRDVDVVVVGAGIVGLATAHALATAHGVRSVLVLDKEDEPATHQSGRNSNVVHSGIYSPPGSRKAAMVADGRSRLVALTRRHGIPLELCGKVVVATGPDELGALDSLERRAEALGIEAHRLGPVALRSREPHVVGLAALEVPGAGITDYRSVTRALVDELESAGGEVRTATAVLGAREHRGEVDVEVASGTVRARWLVNCAGLHSDRVAASAGRRPDVRIMPFRGEYATLRPAAAHLVRHLVYPVPDPRFPFLGVHLTRTVDGHVHAGPNAVVALAREGYRWRDVDAADLWEMAVDPGSWRLVHRYWRTGLGEVHRSLSRAAFLAALRRLVPDLGPGDLEPAPSGVRAQAIGRDGRLVDDFEFADGRRSIHVVNAPSPAATASLSIGDAIARRLLARKSDEGPGG